MSRPDLFNYSDAHIVVKGRIYVSTTAKTDIGQKIVRLK